MTQRVYNIREFWFDSPLGEITAYCVVDNLGNEYGRNQHMNIDRAERLQTDSPHYSKTKKTNKSNTETTIRESLKMLEFPKTCALCGKPWSINHTNECEGHKPKRGRPTHASKGLTAMTVAERQAARRERITATISRAVATLDQTMHHIEQMHLKAENKNEILMALALIAQDLSDHDNDKRE